MMGGLGLDPANDILFRLNLTKGKGKKRLMKDPFIVCKLFGYAKEMLWQASDRYWQIKDSITPETANPANLAALDKAETSFNAWMTIKLIRDEALGLMHPRGPRAEGPVRGIRRGGDD